VSVLRDFESSPVEARQSGDEAGNDAGLADAPGVAANDENGHKAWNSNFPICPPAKIRVAA
jgi:hypothetical protein